LQYIADGGVEPQLGALPGIPSVNEKGALGGLVEAADQIDKGGFACACLAYDGKMGTEGNIQGEILQNGLLAVGVLEADIPEGNVTL